MNETRGVAAGRGGEWRTKGGNGSYGDEPGEWRSNGEVAARRITFPHCGRNKGKT